MKQHNRLIIGLFFIIACCFQLNAQNVKSISSGKNLYSEEFIHEARELYDWHKVEEALSKRLQISPADCNNFFTHIYKNKLTDYRDYLSKVKDGSITKSNAEQYWQDQLPVFEKLYHQEQKNILKRSVISPRLPAAPSATCNNLDFTNGTTGWSAKWNDQNDVNHYLTAPMNLPANGFNSSGGTNANAYVHELVTAGTDPYTPISRVPPGHTSAIRLGDDEAMYLTARPYPYNHQMVRNTFRVTPTNPTITYWYAVVFSQATKTPLTGPHSKGDQPYFRIRLFDKDGNEIKCASYDVDITKGISGGFVVKKLDDDIEIVYKDWVPIYIPLINYINQDVTIQFESSDCNAGGHVGYAYVAVDCAPFEVITTTPYICGSNTIQLTAPNGASSYSWTGPGVVPPNNTQTITANAPGKYKVTMTVVGNENITCTFDLDTVIPGNTKLPVALFSNTTVCVGEPTVFKDESTPAGTITAWAWDFNNDGVTDSNLPNPSYTFAAAGTFPVKLTIKQGPCEGTITKNITVEPLPLLKITNPPPVCLPNKIDITQASVTAGSTAGTLSYWTNSTATAPLASPEAVIAGTYYIKVTTAAGCTDIKPVVVTTNPGAVLVITNPPAVCSPGTVDITLPAVTAGSSTGTLSYWTDADATIALSNANAISVSGTYYIKSTPSTGCIDIKPVVVTINPKPTLVITDPPAVCMPATVDITAASVTAGSTAGGTLSYWNNSAATIPLPMLPNKVTASGTYYIKIVVAGGCEDIKPVNVVVNELPVSNAGPDVVICTGDAATLGTTAVTTYTYQWNPQTGLSSGTVSNPTVTLTNTGKFPVSTIYVVNTTNSVTGCTTTDTVKVTVNSVPTVNAGSAASVCPGTVVELSGAIGGSATSATWIGGNGIFGNRNDLKTTYKPTDAEFSAGTITLTLQSNDPDGPCTFASSDVILTFYKNPTVKYTVDKRAGCPVHCVNFTDSSLVEGTADYIERWSWNFGDPTSLNNNTSNLQKPQHCYANTGFYDVKLTVTSNHGCVSTLATPQMIQVYAVPVADFIPTPNPVSVLNPKVTLLNRSSEDVIYWNYHFGDGDSISPNVPSPVHMYPDVASTSYTATLYVRNKDGCVNSIQRIVEVGPEFTFYIPNAFTPDGDGVNDYFFGTGIGIVQYDLTIFDRWGNLIFHSEKLEHQWDGRAHNGEEIAQQDVYVWKVKLTDVFGKKHSYIGTVTLVK